MSTSRSRRALGAAAMSAAMLAGAFVGVPEAGATSVSPTATLSSGATAARTDPYAVPSTGGIRLAPTARGSLSGRTVVVDPGHNGRWISRVGNRLVPAGNGRRKPCNTSGTASRSGAAEHAFTWNLAGRVASILRARGATVVMTRPTDRGVGPCVDERAAIVNRNHADLVLSIHADGNNARSARGFHVITSTTMAGGAEAEAASTRYARLVRTAFATTGMPRSTYLGRGTAITPRRDIAGLNLSTRPGIMLEAGNMRHPRDAALLGSSTFRARAARALADATQQMLTR